MKSLFRIGVALSALLALTLPVLGTDPYQHGTYQSPPQDPGYSQGHYLRPGVENSYLEQPGPGSEWSHAYQLPGHMQPAPGYPRHEMYDSAHRSSSLAYGSTGYFQEPGYQQISQQIPGGGHSSSPVTSYQRQQGGNARNSEIIDTLHDEDTYTGRENRGVGNNPIYRSEIGQDLYDAGSTSSNGAASYSNNIYPGYEMHGIVSNSQEPGYQHMISQQIPVGGHSSSSATSYQRQQGGNARNSEIIDTLHDEDTYTGREYRGVVKNPIHRSEIGQNLLDRGSTSSSGASYPNNIYPGHEMHGSVSNSQEPGYQNIVIQQIPGGSSSSTSDSVRRREHSRGSRLRNVAGENSQGYQNQQSGDAKIIKVFDTSHDEDTYTGRKNSAVEKKHVYRSEIGQVPNRGGSSSSSVNVDSRAGTYRMPISSVILKQNKQGNSYTQFPQGGGAKNSGNDDLKVENEYHQRSETEHFHQVPNIGIPFPRAPGATSRNTTIIKTAFIRQPKGDHTVFHLPANGETKDIKITHETKYKKIYDEAGLPEKVREALARARRQRNKNKNLLIISGNQAPVIHKSDSPVQPIKYPTSKPEGPINPPSPPVQKTPSRTSEEISLKLEEQETKETHGHESYSAISPNDDSAQSNLQSYETNNVEATAITATKDSDSNVESKAGAETTPANPEECDELAETSSKQKEIKTSIDILSEQEVQKTVVTDDNKGNSFDDTSGQSNSPSDDTNHIKATSTIATIDSDNVFTQTEAISSNIESEEKSTVKTCDDDDIDNTYEQPSNFPDNRGPPRDNKPASPGPRPTKILSVSSTFSTESTEEENGDIEYADEYYSGRFQSSDEDYPNQGPYRETDTEKNDESKTINTSSKQTTTSTQLLKTSDQSTGSVIKSEDSEYSLSDVTKISGKKTTPADNNNDDNQVYPDDDDLPLYEDEQASAAEASAKITYKIIDGAKCFCEVQEIEKYKEKTKINESSEKHQRDDSDNKAIQNAKREIDIEEVLSKNKSKTVESSRSDYKTKQVKKQESTNAKKTVVQETVKKTTKGGNDKTQNTPWSAEDSSAPNFVLLYNLFRDAIKG